MRRNRLKRILREHLRLFLPINFPAVDLVLRAEASAYATAEGELRSELNKMLKRVAESRER